MLKKLEFQSLNGAEEIDHASAYHQIRLFTVARYASEKPVAELEEEYILQQWAVKTDATLCTKKLCFKGA